MKTIIRNMLAAMLLAAASLQANAQGIIDQESATSPVQVLDNGNADGLNIQEDSPLLQSFVPILSAIDFVSLEFEDAPGNGTAGATVDVNLYTGSPYPQIATLLGTSAAVYMPNGFNNSGLFFAGIATFDFSTLIALTPGQAYYLEPVVLSGDNPWDIVTIGNTYPNGRVFEDGIGLNSDFWFQEGILAVPEPAIYALFGLGILVLAYKRRSNLPMLLFACLLFSVPVLTTHASDSVTAVTADAAGLTAISPSDLPANGGTYWVTLLNGNGGLTALPWPFLPTNLDDPTIYSITNQVFLVDTTAGKLSTSDSAMSAADATTAAQSQATSMATLIENIESPPVLPGSGGTNGDGGTYTPQPEGISINPDGLYIMPTNEVPDGLGGLGFLIFNPDSSQNYQLLSTTNLLSTNTNWCLGQVIFNPNGSPVNPFTPIPMTNAMTFYRVHQADPVWNIQNYQNSTEISATNDLGQQGYFYLYNEGGQTNDVPVYYSVSGTAQNGIAYSNLTGVVIVSNNVNYAYIYINPRTNGFQPDLNIILTLKQNPNYLIDPNHASDTNTLFANPKVYPTVNGDLETVCPDSPNTFDISANDSDPRGLPLTYTIVTYPTHGNLTGTPPLVTYTATNCYEGEDSFTYAASDGQFSSTATVTLNIADQVVFFATIDAQTCRGTSLPITLVGYDTCSDEPLNYYIAVNPTNGSVTGTPPNVYYIPTGTNYTGYDSFNYVAESECGSFATNNVLVTIGDSSISATSQTWLTGTNDPVAITLSANGISECNEDNNDFTYTVTSEPTYGTLTNVSGANLTYIPATNFEGVDSFQFFANDGYWTNGPATVTIDVTAGPILFQQCNPYGGVLLDWMLDTNEQQMSLNIQDYIVYRSTNSGVSYTAIATNSPGNDTYLDTNNAVGPTNYYVVTFQAKDSTGLIVESPRSNQLHASDPNANNFISADSFWEVVTNLADTNIVMDLQAPLSNFYPNQYPGIYPLPNSHWDKGTTNLVTTTMFVPTNTDLSQVQFSIAIDNNYYLYLNNSYVTYFHHEDEPTWAPFQTFDSLAPGVIHYGTNTVHLEIIDEGFYNYFSMVVTTNTCGM